MIRYKTTALCSLFGRQSAHDQTVGLGVESAG
jgi:hypothetical protein